MKKLKNLKVVDLFAGCGGMSLGFKNAGFEIVAAFDNWEPAIRVYRDNFQHPIHQIDLSELNTACDLIRDFNPNIIIGGPPCQDFSHAGKRDENLGRGDLTIIFAKIIENIKPLFFVMENVDQIVKTDKLKQAFEIFKKSSYGLTSKKLDASLCKVPQKRKRFFLIGELFGKDGALSNYLDSGLSARSMTMREYFKDKLKIDFYYRHPRTYKRRAIYSMDEPSPTIRGVNRPIPPNYSVHPIDATSNLKKVRPLTTIERSYVQTFPDNFKFKGSKTVLEQLIGNAVPVKQAEHVAISLLKYIKDTERIPTLPFRISDTIVSHDR